MEQYKRFIVDNEQGKAQFLHQIHEKERRMLKARRTKNFSIWEHLGTLGLIGWSIALPVVLGAALGWFLDKELSTGHELTLLLLIVGLGAGCWNACYWVCKQYRQINGNHKEDHE
jgi:ATP synthase protein I